jgi:phosphoribosylformylglycinamidine synthase subunit PurQ / glutaminase
MTIAVVSYPGSNCDRDCVAAVERAAHGSAALVWHKDGTLPPDTTGVILPGGFSYGDYLRGGALAALSPITGAVRRFAESGGPVLGICNGFQILCELGLLPGVLRQNRDGLFLCRPVGLEVCGGGKGLLADYVANERITLPIAHGEGNFFVDDQQMKTLAASGRIALRYLQRDEDGNGRLTGSLHAVAGLLGGPAANVLGLMPHPERRAETRLGGTDGLRMLTRLVRFGKKDSV